MASYGTIILLFCINVAKARYGIIFQLHTDILLQSEYTGVSNSAVIPSVKPQTSSSVATVPRTTQFPRPTRPQPTDSGEDVLIGSVIAAVIGIIGIVGCIVCIIRKICCNCKNGANQENGTEEDGLFHVQCTTKILCCTSGYCKTVNKENVNKENKRIQRLDTDTNRTNNADCNSIELTRQQTGQETGQETKPIYSIGQYSRGNELVQQLLTQIKERKAEKSKRFRHQFGTYENLIEDGEAVLQQTTQNANNEIHRANNDSVHQQSVQNTANRISIQIERTEFTAKNGSSLQMPLDAENQINLESGQHVNQHIASRTPDASDCGVSDLFTPNIINVTNGETSEPDRQQTVQNATLESGSENNTPDFHKKLYFPTIIY